MFFGLREMPKEADRIIIVEGEADVIALESVGIKNVWSIPNGAPLKVSKGRVDPQEDTKFSYVWDAWDELESAKQIILATDADTPGEALKQELARRIGLEKCWEIFLPDECKDVTDVIRQHGSDAAKNLFTNAKQMPLQGVYDVESYMGSVMELYDNGVASGESCGLAAVDDLFTIKEGMVYIVTGYPGSGKSEFVDQVMMNLATRRQWKWAVASFENQPSEHLTKLIEKYHQKPFYKGRSPRMKKSEVAEAVEMLNNHFVFLEQKDGRMATMQSIISRIKLSIARCGTRGAVIDPYNYIDMSEYENENKGISTILSELSAFARANGIAVFFVAHPQKLIPDSAGVLAVPRGSHISGSAAWWAKADVGFTVHRPDRDVPKAEVHCWKARYKWLGREGKATISYCPSNGVYSDLTDVKQWKDFSGDF
jgi:twinkle protein